MTPVIRGRAIDAGRPLDADNQDVASLLTAEAPGISKPGATRLRRLGHIDGLRALAALGVLICHAFWYSDLGRYGSSTPLGRFLMMGAHGVDLFFVVSGFCLAYPYLTRVRAGSPYAFDLVPYMARRLVRILPPYYAAIVVLAVTFTLLHLHSAGLTALALVQQVLFLDRDQSYLTSPFWTLSIEFRWYVAFPLLLALFVRLPRVFALLGAGAYVLFYTTRLDAVDVGTLPAFMLGIWAADLEITRSPLRRYAPAVFIPCAVAAFAMMSGQQYFAVQPVGVVASFALVVAAGWMPWLRRALSAPPLVGLGIASYSIYLFHEPVIAYCEGLHHAPLWLGASAALALSLVFFLLGERPFLSGPLRDRLIGWLERGLSAGLGFLIPAPYVRARADRDAQVAPSATSESAPPRPLLGAATPASP